VVFAEIDPRGSGFANKLKSQALKAKIKQTRHWAHLLFVMLLESL
jgi:hypothetical protein